MDAGKDDSRLPCPPSFNDDFRLTARKWSSMFLFPEGGSWHESLGGGGGVSCQDSGPSPPTSGPTENRPPKVDEKPLTPASGVRSAAPAGNPVQASSVPSPARLIF